jgi:hypothetical protein
MLWQVRILCGVPNIMTYFINETEKCIINGKNGDIIKPSCIDDLIIYHKYVLDSEGEREASQLLKRVVNGEKVISDMIHWVQHRFDKRRY